MKKKIIISKQTYQLMYISSKLSSSMNLSYLSHEAQSRQLGLVLISANIYYFTL